MKTIQFAGKSFALDASGLLFWPDRGVAVAADLHLEKATYFAGQGQLLPPQESFETLSKLLAALDRTECRSLILLGDSFHDVGGFDRLDNRAMRLWEKICSRYSVTFVLGNHDGTMAPPQTQGADFLEMERVIFRHQATPQAFAEISGHYHPKASLRLRGKRITRPCFVTDANRIILPAFGTLTGGMNVKSGAITELFASDFVVHILGEDKVYSVPADRL